jgi:peptidoglycan/xylan/chitin deacetylase (PgdA/CDA1 family)
VVLYYHSVLAQHRQAFARQMDVLLRCATPINAGAKGPLPPGRRYAAVTFDDAFENVLHNAIPELQARKIPATIFVVSGNLGACPRWRNLDTSCNGSERIMTAEQLMGLPQDLIAIGSHTVSHAVLTDLSAPDAKREILESRVSLERVLGQKVALFSFPYGALNSRLVDCCREAGYERTFSIEPVGGRLSADEFVTGRVAVEPDDWALEFRLKALGAYRWQAAASRVKRKVLGADRRRAPPG